MKQITLNIKNFDFVEIKESKDSKNTILNGIKTGLKEAKLYKEGKIKLRTAKELLDELSQANGTFTKK